MVVSLGEGELMKKSLFVSAVLCMFGVQEIVVAGGELANVRGMGMARTFVGASRGLDAVGINPANLALEDNVFTVSLAPFGVHAGSDFLTYGSYNKYFTGTETTSGRVATYLDDNAKQDLLSAFHGGVGQISADLSARLIGISFQIESMGGFAFTITDQLSATASVQREYFEFALYGNPPGSTYNFNGTSAQASWLREYALSFGGRIPPLAFLDWMSLGASVKIVQGFGFYEFGQFNTSLATSDDGILTGHVSYVSRVAGKDPNGSFRPGIFGMPVVGFGTGFDLGIAGGTNSNITFGLSLVDIGKVNWAQKIEETTADTTLVVDDPSQVEDGEAITNSLKGKTKTGMPFSTSLPTKFRAGVAFQLDKMIEWIPGELLLGVDLNQGLVEVPGATTRTRVSAGIEWKLLQFLPIRTGVSFGGTDHFNYAFGFGVNVGFFDLDLATENMELLWSPNNFSHGSIAVGTRFRF